MGVLNWSLAAARNAVVDPLIRALDGASAREYPALIRGVMSGVRAFSDDQGGALVSEGTGNGYVVKTASGVAELRPGIALSFWADRDNTDEPFLNVDGTGPLRWRDADGLPLPAGSVQGGLLYTVVLAGALPGSLTEWRMASGGGGFGSSGIAFSHSGAPADRSLYDAALKGTTFLSVADTPVGPSWILYLKRSDAFGDWSTGLPIKASPAQSTADAQAAADLARSSADAAADQAAVASTQASAVADQVNVVRAQADIAVQASANARAFAAALGTAIFDFSYDSTPDPSNDWSVG